MSNECPHCTNGRIFVAPLKSWQPCPYCNGAVAEVKRSEEVKQSIDKKLLDLKVPSEYLDKTFDVKNFIIDPEAYKIFSEQSISEVIEKLVEIEEKIKSGEKLKHSYYIYTSVMSDYLSFVHSCMRAAILRNFSVKPFISLVDLAELRRGNASLIKEYDSLYTDYTSCDICFLFAPAGASKNYDIVSLADVLSERERRGLPTIVIGYWAKDANSLVKSGIKFLLASPDVKPSYLRMEYVGFTPIALNTKRQSYMPQQGLSSFVADISNSEGEK